MQTYMPKQTSVKLICIESIIALRSCCAAEIELTAVSLPENLLLRNMHTVKSSN